MTTPPSRVSGPRSGEEMCFGSCRCLRTEGGEPAARVLNAEHGDLAVNSYDES